MIFDKLVSVKKDNQNQVDKLLKRVKQIRNKCQHDFRMKNPVDLQESKVRGVYIVGAKGHFREVTIVCMKCSELREVSLSKVCPACLGDVKPDGYHTLRPEYYPDGEYLYYGAFTGSCSSCGLMVVWDEWDQ